MKRSLIIVMLLVMVCSLSTGALAYTQQQVYSLEDRTSDSVNNATWFELSSGDAMAKARAYTGGDGGAGSCDQKDWTIDIKNHVTVTQWIDWSIDATSWSWQVRKPGTYAADCMGLRIKSNDDVGVTFSNFTDLTPLIHTGALASSDWAPPIKVQYALTTGNPSDSSVTIAWQPAVAAAGKPSINGAQIQIPYSSFVKVANGEVIGLQDYYTKVWNLIDVPAYQRACDYEGSGRIVLQALDVKYFVDGGVVGGPYNSADPTLNPYPSK